MRWLVHLLLFLYRRRHPDRPQPWPQAAVLPQAPRCVLVFANTALGDTLLCTPALKVIRDNWPQARIVFFVHQRYRELFADHEDIDVLIPYAGGWHGFLPTLMRLRRQRPDVALLLHSNGPQDVPTAVLSGARIVLKPCSRSEWSHWLSARLPERAQHVIEDKLDTLRQLGARISTTRMQPGQRHLSARLAGDGWRHIGLQMGAANVYKCWPVESFTALARRLLETPQLRIHLLGSANEAALAQQLAESLGHPPELSMDCGRYRIAELPAALRQLDLLISNDTGPMHLGIALGVPTLCLFAATDPARIGPYQDLDRHRVIFEPGLDVQKLAKKERSDVAMRRISVDTVYNEAQRMLEKMP